MRIELEEKAADVIRKLQAQAVACRLTLDDYLESFVEPGREASSDDTISMEDFDQILDELAGAAPSESLPASFSRADIYSDHD